MTTTTRTIAAAVLGLTLLSLGCSAKGEGRDRQSAKPAVAVEVTPATATALDLAIEVVGTLEPKFFADVKSEFTAVVEEVYVTQWVHVDKGTPLAKLDTREADATLQAAKAFFAAKGIATAAGVAASAWALQSRRPATAEPLVPSTCRVSRSSRRTRTHQLELKWQMMPLSSSKVA